MDSIRFQLRLRRIHHSGLIWLQVVIGRYFHIVKCRFLVGGSGYALVLWVDSIDLSEEPFYKSLDD